MCRRHLLGRHGHGYDYQHDQVHDHTDAAGKHRKQGEYRPHRRHIDSQVGSQAVADAAQHATLTNAEQVARRDSGIGHIAWRLTPLRAGGGARARTRRHLCSAVRAGIGTGTRGTAFHRTHLLQGQSDLLGRDHVLVCADPVRQFVGDGLLQIGENLIAIRIALESGLGALQIGGERFAALGFNLPGVAVQADRIDRAHDQAPTSSIVLLMRRQ